MTMAREGHGVAWLPVTLAKEDLARAVWSGLDRTHSMFKLRLGCFVRLIVEAKQLTSCGA